MKQDNIWEYFQNQATYSFKGSHPRISHLVKLILKYKKNKKVLNVGIGDGTFEKLCIKYCKEVWSLDPSANAIKKIENEFKGIKGIVGYIENINLPENYFSAIVASEVLEHLTNSQLKKALFNIYRALEHSGVFIGTVPYNENLQDNITVCPKCGAVFHRWGHQQSFNLISIKKLLSNYFERVDVKIKYFPSSTQLNWKGKIFAFAKKIASVLGIHGKGENILFCAIKKPDIKQK